MSRAYRVKWETASQTVRSSDAVDLGVDLLGILPEVEMGEILAEELKADGWKAKGSTSGDGGLTKKVGDTVASLSEDKKTIRIELGTKTQVTASARTKRQAKEDAKRQGEALKGKLDAETTQALTKAEADLRDALASVVQRTYKRALERRAAKLGEVQSVHEGQTADGDIEVTIKIKA